MLALTRKVGERIRIGNNIWVKGVKIHGDSKVRLAVDAPREIPIFRAEIKGEGA